MAVREKAPALAPAMASRHCGTWRCRCLGTDVGEEEDLLPGAKGETLSFPSQLVAHIDDVGNVNDESNIGNRFLFTCFLSILPFQRYVYDEVRGMATVPYT